MSADKYLSIISRQIEAIIYIYIIYSQSTSRVISFFSENEMDIRIDHFRVALNLMMKARLSAKFLL